MKCTEFRDLAELLRDGALEAAEAGAARSHLSGCPACRSYEEDGALMAASFRGLPPGPYLPPVGPGRLPPWASGSVLGVLLALLLAGGGTAWALFGSPRPPAVETRGIETARTADPAPRPAPPVVKPPAPSIFAAEGGGTLMGRVVSFPGGKPVAGAAIRIDGVLASTTDAVGVFRVRDLAPAGSRLLSLEPPVGPPSEALLPELTPDEIQTLADLLVGPPGSATVRVVRWDALPAAGVRVRACRLARTVFPDSIGSWKAGTRGNVLPAIASALTDAEGVAEFPALPPGSWTFQAERNGLPFSRLANLEIRDEPDHATTLFLDPARAIEGRVLDDATGKPVAGAEVRWTRVGGRTGSSDIRSGGATTSDSEGRFRFPDAPACPLFLDVRRPAAPCKSGGTCVDASRIDRVDIRLPATGVIAGVCVEAGTGLPAAGAVLSVSADFRDGASGGWGSHYTLSGPDGRFEVRGLPATAILKVVLVPRTSWCTGSLETTYLRVGTPYRLEVSRTGSVKGMVRTIAGDPGAGRTVVALGTFRHAGSDEDHVVLLSQTFADAEGRFLLENLPQGRAVIASPGKEDLGSPLLLGEGRIALRASEAPPSIVTVSADARATLTIPPRDPDPGTAVTVLESGTWTIAGKVLDLAGAPVPGAALYALQGDLSPMLERRDPSFIRWMPLEFPVPVAGDGSFLAEIPMDRRPGAPRAEAFTLIALSPRHPMSFAVARFRDREVVEGVLVSLEEGLSLSGRVLREDGSPAAGALLEANPQLTARPNDTTTIVRARAEEDGTFRIDGLTRGRHTLVVGRGPGPVHAVGGLLPGGDPVEVRLPAGDGVRPDPPILPLLPGSWKKPERTSSIEGRILGSDRMKVRLTSVLVFEANSASDPVIQAPVDEEGRFKCGVHPGRRYSVAANLKDGRWLYADDVAPDSKETVFRMDGAPPGFLQGRVVTPAGAPASGIQVHAVRLRETSGSDGPPTALLDGREWSVRTEMDPAVPRRVRTTLTGSDGSFDLGSPSGKWAVFAGLPGSEELAPGPAVPWYSADPQPLEVTLAPGRVLQVRCVDDDAPPDAAAPAWAEVRMDGFLPGAEGPVLAVRLAPLPGGLFEFRGLPAGRVTVVLLDDLRKEMGRGVAEPGDGRDPPAGIRVTRGR